MRFLQPLQSAQIELSSPPRAPMGLHSAHAASICVASGKGGTGKSVISAAIAALCSEQQRTLLVDADLGVGNAHLMQGVQPALSLVDVVRGRASSSQALTACAPRLDLLAGGSGVSQMSALTQQELARIANGIEELDAAYDVVVVDSAAGISEQTVAFASSADLVVIVTTTDPAAMTDAYAFLKVLFARHREAQVDLLVNRTSEANEGARTAERIDSVCRRFMGRGVHYLGCVPDDRSVCASVGQRQCVVRTAPQSAAASALRKLHHELSAELAGLPHLGLGRCLAASCAANLPRG